MLENIKNISGNFINAFAQVFISIAVSKMFSPEYYGQFVYILAIAYMLSVLFNFGYNVFGLVFFSKKYYNILRLLINYSYLALALILLLCFSLNFIDVGIASIYVFLVLLKELFNNSLVIEKKINRKIYFNVLDLTLLILSFIGLYILGIKQIDIGLLFGILILTKLSSFVYLYNDKSLLILKPLPIKQCIRYFMVFFRIVRFNSLNVLFTTIYTQGYFVVIGSFLTFSDVSLIKYLSLIQANLNIVTNSLVQLKSHFFKRVSTKLSELKGLFQTLLFIQISGVLISFALIYYLSLFKLLFDIIVTDYTFVFVVLLSFTFTPIKQTLGLFLTSKNLFMERTNSIIISVILAFPLLFLLNYSLYFIAAYFITVDLVAVLLFTKSVSKWRS